jgi:hypothetical protein
LYTLKNDPLDFPEKGTKDRNPELYSLVIYPKTKQIRFENANWNFSPRVRHIKYPALSYPQIQDTCKV